jgi:hypothetical protein
MNRAIKEATVQRYHYDRHDQLEAHLADFITAYNYARRLKTLKGFTPYEYICKCWTSQPERFRPNPLQQMPGLNRVRHRYPVGDGQNQIDPLAWLTHTLERIANHAERPRLLAY